MPIRRYLYRRRRTRWIERVYQPTTRMITVCHGCGVRFRPQYRDNVRCWRCQRMTRILAHQKYKARGVRGYERHTCRECRWALRRGLHLKRE